MHELLHARRRSVALIRAEILQRDDRVILETAHKLMRGDALTAQETGAILARGFGFALILARGANGLFFPLGGVDAHHGRHHVVERERLHRLTASQPSFLRVDKGKGYVLHSKRSTVFHSEQVNHYSGYYLSSPGQDQQIWPKTNKTTPSYVQNCKMSASLLKRTNA